MFGLHPLDFTVMAGYLVLLAGVGFWYSRMVRNTGDFFVGGRRFGKFLTIMMNFGVGTHSEQAVGVIAKTYEVGLAGIWYQWLWLIIWPFYQIAGPVIRRVRVVTTADYFRKRYDRPISVLYAVLALVILMLSIGMMLLGSGRIVESVTGGKLPFGVTVAAMTVLFVSYGMAGGLVSAIYTDVLQGVLTMFLSFAILPFAYVRAGGFAGLHARLADTPHDFFSLVVPGDITVFFIVMMVVNAFVNWIVHPHRFAIMGSSTSEEAIHSGLLYGSLAKRICTVAWAFTGLFAIALIPDVGNPDHAFGEIVRSILPVGLVGLFLASVLAAVQSSCDAFMVSASGIFTRNIYRELFVKGKTDAHYLMVGRISSLAVVVGGLCFTFFLPGVVAALELFFKIPALIGIPAWLGLFWRRANPASVWASFIAAATVFILCEADLFAGVEVSLPVEMLAYLIAGFAAAVATGLLTPPQPREQLDSFYDDLFRPVVPGEIVAEDTM